MNDREKLVELITTVLAVRYNLNALDGTMKKYKIENGHAIDLINKSMDWIDETLDKLNIQVKGE